MESRQTNLDEMDYELLELIINEQAKGVKGTYPEDKKICEKFSTKIKQILGEHFITTDPIKDMKEGKDFMIFNVKPFNVGARLRTYYFYSNPQKRSILNNCRNEFTIRWDRPSGVKTEIHKIREGLVDYNFYGFVDADELVDMKKIIQFFIGDLEVFRRNEPRPIGIYKNKNKFGYSDSRLAVYRISQLPKEFIIAKRGFD